MAMANDNMSELQRLTAQAMGYTDECRQCKKCKHFSPHDWDHKASECTYSNIVDFPVSETGHCEKFTGNK